MCVCRLPSPPSKSKQKDTTHFLLATSTIFSVECSPSRTSAKNVFQKTRQIILRGSDSPQEFKKYLSNQYIFSTSFWCPCRGIVAFNFSPRNLTQVTSAMKPGQCMIWFCFGKENNSSQRVILKIELELNNLNSILSRSAVTPVFPLPLAQVEAWRG